MPSSDLESLKTSVKEGTEAISSLRERTVRVETKMDGVEKKIDSMDTRLDAHIVASANSHGSLTTKVDSVIAKFDTLATKEDLKVRAGLLANVDPNAAKVVGAIIAGIIMTMLGLGGAATMIPDSAATSKPPVEIVAPAAPAE